MLSRQDKFIIDGLVGFCEIVSKVLTGMIWADWVGFHFLGINLSFRGALKMRKSFRTTLWVIKSLPQHILAVHVRVDVMLQLLGDVVD